MLKCAAGLIPFEGEIFVKDTNIRQQRRAYLQQVNFAEDEHLYPSFLTGKDMLSFYFKSKGGDTRCAQELIKALGVNHYLEQKIGSYSSGMVKKLSLVLAFIGYPLVILLDEPFITLDRETVQVLQYVIEEKHLAGVSFCISSHQEFELNSAFSTLHIHHKKAELI